MQKGTYFFVKLRRALAPLLRYLLEQSSILRFFGVTAMRWYLKPVTEWDGHTVHVNPSDFGVSFELESTGEYEAMSMKCCKEILKPGMVFVDVGANIGLFSLMAARQVGPEGHVYAFEPGAGNCALLRKNMEQNGYKNVTVIEKAVSDKSGTCTLYESGFNPADHRTYHVSKGRKQVTIQSISLDEYFPADARIDMLKMDIEGAEETAIRGMERVLGICPVLLLECWPSMLAKAGTDAVKLFKNLEERGYKLSLVDDAGGAVTPMSAEEAVRYCTENEVANVLCVRG